MNHSLDGKVAVITGGTQGIGFAIAEEFVKNGATVVVTGRDESRLDEAVEKLGAEASGIRADAGSPSAMDALIMGVKAQHGRLDAFVANAVVDDHAPLGRITEEQFDRMIGVNLKGVLFAVQSAARLMRSGGSIILIGSTASVAPPAGMSIYGAIKAGFHGMVRALIQDLNGTGIRVNVLSPGAVDTPSLRRALSKVAGESSVDEIVQSMAQRSPLKRIGTPQEIGQVAVFLASDASSYVNGVELFADGGLTQVA